ncbi:hypothetical protein [Halococcus agarilyticus]|uniref:hypothetical protein n=1 Tax=Halococcus agarilyticus TaxID=1232219 RepID=UPI00067805BA|nr:hypothetical protein [Halococcus agarilyticus]
MSRPTGENADPLARSVTASDRAGSTSGDSPWMTCSLVRGGAAYSRFVAAGPSIRSRTYSTPSTY